MSFSLHSQRYQLALSPATPRLASIHANDFMAEIRIEIYRYLLLPNSVIEICPEVPPPSKLPKLIDPDDGSEKGTESEDEWTDEEDDDSDVDSMMWEFMHDFETESISDDEDSSFDSGVDEDEETAQRHFAILRTNQQIRDEGQSLFYSEAVVTLDAGDIFSLARKPEMLKFGYPNPLAWKHNPLFGIGKKNKNGIVSYGTSQLIGDIEPHIFAQFQKISFNAFFDDEHTQNFELWIDDETHVIETEDASQFRKVLRSSSLFKDLFTILFNSHRITFFEVSGIEVEVMANSKLLMADETESDEENEDYLENRSKVDKILEIANQKATECFLDSKIMDSLLQLTNVSKCNFEFGFTHLDGEEAYKPPEKYVKMLRAMKDKIEGNFKDAVLAA